MVNSQSVGNWPNEKRIGNTVWIEKLSSEPPFPIELIGPGPEPAFVRTAPINERPKSGLLAFSQFRNGVTRPRHCLLPFYPYVAKSLYVMRRRGYKMSNFRANFPLFACLLFTSLCDLLAIARPAFDAITFAMYRLSP